MRLDIVIPTFNRSALLKECLESVLRSSSADGWRVTVVDNNSSDDTAEVVASFAATGRVRYLFEKSPGKSAALNHAISASDADAIGLIDDDERIHPGWIDTALEWLSRPEIDFIGGPCLGLWRTRKPDWMPPGYEGVISADDESLVPSAPLRFSDSGRFLRGGNAVIRRSVLKRLGPYRLDLGRSAKGLGSCEDDDMFRRLQAAGTNGYYVPSLIIYHLVLPERVTRAYFRKWVWDQSRSLAAVDREHAQNVSYLGKIPRYMIGDAVRHLPWLASSDPARRFAAELRWRTLAGFAMAAYWPGRAD